MNFRNFDLEKDDAELLVFRSEHYETGFPIVKLYCYWEDKEGNNRLNEETIQFENEYSAQSFINDFSESSAEHWFLNNIEHELTAAQE